MFILGKVGDKWKQILRLKQKTLTEDGVHGTNCQIRAFCAVYASQEISPSDYPKFVDFCRRIDVLEKKIISIQKKQSLKLLTK